MESLPSELVAVLITFQPLFTRPVFEHVKLLVAGAILAPGKRTVSSILRVLGKTQERGFGKFHRVLSRASWSTKECSRALLGLLVRTFCPQGAVVMGIDDTIERRWGEKIAARGIYRDPVRSSHSHFVKASGLRWLSLMLLCPIRWAGRLWALPFCTELCPSERYYSERGLEPKTLVQRAAEVLKLVASWLPGRKVVVVADSSFAALEFLEQVRHCLTLITRLRLDAALYEPAPARKPRQNGRPRKKGARLPTLQQRLSDPKECWKTIRVSQWYGQGPREVQLLSETAVWYHTGLPPVPIRWVLIRDPLGKFDPQALLCTDLAADPAQILEWFVGRWQMEVTFEESRSHLGIETQRQWSDKAIARTTPALLALYSIITLIAEHLIEGGQPPVRTSAWYAKEQPTFSDTIALVRRHLWGWRHFQTSTRATEMIKVPRAFLDTLTDSLCYAA